MTIGTTASRVDYAGDGTSTNFPVPWPFFDASELRVVRRVTATGVETVLTLGADYTVTGGGGSTGAVLATVAPAASVRWVILRNTRRTQEVDYQANDSFPAETHERALDRAMAVIQEVERDATRAVRVSETDTASLVLPAASARANRFLAFDSAGNPTAETISLGDTPVTAYGAQLLAAPAASAARTTLGATSVGSAVFTAVDAAAGRSALGGTATGGAVFGAVDAAAGRVALGAGATGSALFAAASAAIARGVLGGTTTGEAVFTAADAAAGRVALAAPALPAAASGPGQWVAVLPGTGAAAVLPAGGTWAHFVFRTIDASATFDGNFSVGVNAGGASIGAGVAGRSWVGFAWRIS